MKTFSKYTKVQDIWTTRDVKRSPSGTKGRITDGNMDLHKGMKRTGNSKGMNKYVKLSYYLFKSLYKIIDNLSKNNNVVWYL